VNKTAASTAQFAKCNLLYAYSRTTAAARTQTKTSYSLLKSWHTVSILGIKLITNEAENP